MNTRSMSHSEHRRTSLGLKTLGACLQPREWDNSDLWHGKWNLCRSVETPLPTLISKRGSHPHLAPARNLIDSILNPDPISLLQPWALRDGSDRGAQAARSECNNILVSSLVETARMNRSYYADHLDHSRALPPLVATAQRFEELHPGVRIQWESEVT